MPSFRICQKEVFLMTLLIFFSVACLSVVVPENGSVVEDTNGTVTMASFSCDVGFSLKGQNILSCLQNGSWDLPVPDCSKS